MALAWIFTSLVTISLAFGMVVARKYDVAADNYFYVFLCCAGLYFSQFDRFSVDAIKSKQLRKEH